MPSLIQKHAHVKGQRSNHHIFKFQPNPSWAKNRPNRYTSFNPSKSESHLVAWKNNRNMHPPLIMNAVCINDVQHHNHLGVILSNDCTWHEHIDLFTSKAWQKIYVMRKLKFMYDRDSLNKIYISFVWPTLEYAIIVWDNCTQYETNAIERKQM